MGQLQAQDQAQALLGGSEAADGDIPLSWDQIKARRDSLEAAYPDTQFEYYKTQKPPPLAHGPDVRLILEGA